jgi:hypothetical protein
MAADAGKALSHYARHGVHGLKPATSTVPAVMNRSCRLDRSTLDTTIQTEQMDWPGTRGFP